MVGQLGFFVDSRFCSGCKTCQVACKDKNDLSVGQFYRKVKEFSGGDYQKVGKGWRSNVWCYWISLSCNHCEEPLCVKSCPSGALTKGGKEGLVLVEEELCRGCSACADACPYNALTLFEEKGKVGKCDFCQDLLSLGEDPVCVSACPMRALGYGELTKLKEDNQGVKDLCGLPEAKLTKPSWVILAPDSEK